MFMNLNAAVSLLHQLKHTDKTLSAQLYQISRRHACGSAAGFGAEGAVADVGVISLDAAAAAATDQSSA